MSVLDASALDLIFREARTRNEWADTPISDGDIQAIYELMKWGPTSVNSQPGRFVWIRSDAAKQRLEPHLSAGNRAKTMKAPATVIVAYDTEYHEHLPKLFPHAPTAKDWYADPAVRETNAFRNSTLQGAYLIVAARALGFDCGPMSGFDNAGLDGEFFAGTAIKSNFIIALGHGAEASLRPRNPRHAFEDVNTIL